MTFLDFFANRLKTLRISHNLSMSDLARILNLSNKTVVSRWELAKNGPSNDTLIMISNLFGVSLDWLYGSISNPYNEELIFAIEENILNSEILCHGKIKPLFNKTYIPEAYTNPVLRKATYSLPVRANIIYLLNQEASILTYEYYYRYELNDEPITTLRFNYCKVYSNSEIFLRFNGRHEVYTTQLLKLLHSGKNAIPLFAV